MKESVEKKCFFCATKITTGSITCSEVCQELHYDYILIQISPRWVKNTLEKTKCPERYDLIHEYALRHSFNLKLLKKKLRDVYNLDICKGS